MTALLITLSALFLAMFCREVLDRQFSRTSGDTEESVGRRTGANDAVNRVVGLLIGRERTRRAVPVFQPFERLSA